MLEGEIHLECKTEYEVSSYVLELCTKLNLKM